MTVIASHGPLFQKLPGTFLAPLPLALFQPILQKIAVHIAQSHPEILSRLGTVRKRYLIDPLNMPFVLLLIPDVRHTRLQAFRRTQKIACDARIAGTFLTLFRMIDGRLDGDALFFTRELTIEGDTEAVVMLRNALDDLEGSLFDGIAGQFGPLGQLALTGLRSVRG